VTSDAYVGASLGIRRTPAGARTRPTQVLSAEKPNDSMSSKLPTMILVISIAAIAGCSRSGKSERDERPAHNENRPNFVQTGMASWYGRGLKGGKTASGERFDPEELTAAHRTLPFGTTVRVTNLRNKRSVFVRITNRGPFIRGRIIDVSPAAARELRIVKSGVARVRIEASKPKPDGGE
jgi:rare lipoprotein A